MSSSVCRSRRVWKALVAVAVIAPLFASAAPVSAAVSTVRASVATSGAQSLNGSLTTNPAISADGQVVAFTSGATNLVTGDNNARPDIFVRNLATGITVRASVASDGTEADAASANPTISADGRFVAFQSTATNLVAGDTNAQADIFVFDRQASTTTRASVVTGGAQAGGGSTDPSISTDGRFVAYASAATNLVSGDTNALADIFITDRSGSFTTTRASVATGSTQATGGAASLPSLSRDGRFVSYTSLATNLVAGDTNAARDVFATDTSGTITTTRVSVATGGIQSAGGSNNSSSISADGSIVTFSSDAINLVPGDNNGATDVFVNDRSSGVTTRVSVADGGAQSTGGLSAFPSISANGRFVIFDSTATNLVAGDTNGESDIFMHDRLNVTTSRVSLANGGGQANAGNFFAKVSDDGRFVTYTTDSTNLILGDTNQTADIFVTDRSAPDPLGAGYRLVADDGGIFAFGNAKFLGSTGGIPLAKPIVGTAVTPSKNGYWVVASDGGIFAFGDATFFGSTGALRLNKPIVGMATTPSGKGYWLVASDGGIFAFGDAKFFGSTGALTLNKPIVGMASSATGKGYFLVASDGGIFAFGDAAFKGSTGALTLNKPIVGMAVPSTGTGYWLVASDGGIFAFGDAGFFGSTGALTLNKPIVGMAASPAGRGYWLVATDGGIFAFGDAKFFGSTGALALNRPIVAMSAG